MNQSNIEELLEKFERQVRLDEYDNCSEMSFATSDDRKETAERVDALRTEIIKAFKG